MNAATLARPAGARVHLFPLFAILLAGSVPLFLGVLVSDITYANTDQVQWKNFASWLNAGALLFSGLALLWSVIGLVAGRRHRGSRPLVAAGLLLAGWLLGLVNSLVHAKDAAASLPEGIVLAVLVLALVAAASWFGLDGERHEVRS
jgi:uncharacterized membrane protein